MCPHRGSRGETAPHPQKPARLPGSSPLRRWACLRLGSRLQGKPARRTAGGRVMGLCPLHADRKPSFLVDPNKNLFYCYGCGRGGDVIRFAELYHGARFPQAMALLRRWSGVASLLEDVTKFYQVQLHRHTEAIEYLYQRGLRQPEVIEEL